ncbi:hypothetical protein PSA01_55240 [Pseudonocardia saturnea]|uniref:Uncharacterized protein n=1 Tax=Pseudonocardia saturnea TaxID=33909 RepID=A0ABQ0S6F1_9PSEU|nr:hypothetical protein Pdca_07040 [Pseudonocardia autotrophica]GEC28495.1 hypothetical protein PSA01_55240 [Pseudonocardia saturnea]
MCSISDREVTGRRPALRSGETAPDPSVSSRLLPVNADIVAPPVRTAAAAIIPRHRAGPFGHRAGAPFAGKGLHTVGGQGHTRLDTDRDRPGPPRTGDVARGNR